MSTEHSERVSSTFRAANELIADSAKGIDRTINFICECPDPACLDPVPLTVDEFEARARQGESARTPTHATPSRAA
jgi:hypothetical protein